MLKILTASLILISSFVNGLADELPDFTKLLGEESYEGKNPAEYVTNYFYHTDLEISVIKSQIEEYLGDSWSVEIAPKSLVDRAMQSAKKSEPISGMLLINNPDLPDYSVGANLFPNTEKQQHKGAVHKHILNVVIVDLAAFKKATQTP